MKNPKRFGSAFGVLNASMLPISILYMVVGLLGYLKYGEETKGSITLDMPQDEMWVYLAGTLVFLMVMYNNLNENYLCCFLAFLKLSNFYCHCPYIFVTLCPIMLRLIYYGRALNKKWKRTSTESAGNIYFARL